MRLFGYEWQVPERPEDQKKVSYDALRDAIGMMGIALALVIMHGNFFFGENPEVRTSISAYYYTNMRDIFVGLLLLVAVFMVFYKGYNIIDDVIATVIGLSGAGVVLFPVDITGPEIIKYVGVFRISDNVSNTLHLLSAGLFFFLLGLYSIVIFTQSKCEPKDRTDNKNRRNKVYIACGFIIWLSLITIPLSNVLLADGNEESLITLVVEAIMLLAFGISWLIKGGFMGILRDDKVNNT